MDYLVTGANGQLGRAVLHECERRGKKVLGCAHEGLPVEDAQAVRRVVEAARPRFVLHCAAYTDVDGCERDPARAFRVNATGTANVARAAAEAGAGLLAVSTDFVFDGTQQRP